MKSGGRTKSAGIGPGRPFCEPSARQWAFRAPVGLENKTCSVPDGARAAFQGHASQSPVVRAGCKTPLNAIIASSGSSAPSYSVLANRLCYFHAAIVLPALLITCTLPAAEPGWRARYLVLTATPGTQPPFTVVDYTRGPVEMVDGQGWQWWQVELRTNAEAKTVPLLALRALTSTDPLGNRSALTDGSANSLRFQRYLLRSPEPDEALEYRDRHTGQALLPAWRDFEKWFVPRPATASQRREGVPETCELLGHVLTLAHAQHDTPWPEWKNAKVLTLDRELLVGTGRNVKDTEGHRLPQTPQRQDYHYTAFEEADYRTMIEAGMNQFVVSPEQERWVRAESVFYLRSTDGHPPLAYPLDLYRANYLGPVMFMDEPSILMVGDKLIHNTLRYFSDAAALIEKRTRSTYLSSGGYGAYHLEKSLLSQGVNLGDMRLMQWDYPSWETLFETTFYQMKGGGNGLVHEGRYQLAEFDQAVARFTGTNRTHTAREMLLYYYAFLRGGTRPFRKHWGTAIYGQCDPQIASEAVTLAYDLGARYVWFWTSDHDHHVPWPEQLALARALQAHARQHPRPSIFGPQPNTDAVILIPNGSLVSFESLWWVRVMDKEGKNEASQQYRRFMRRVLEVVEDCFARHESFDVTVDDAHPLDGYRRRASVDR